VRQNHVPRSVISHTEQYSAKEPMWFLRQHSQLHGILLMLHFSDLSQSLTSSGWGLTHVIFLKKCVVSNFVRFYFGAPSDISCRCCPSLSTSSDLPCRCPAFPLVFHRISSADVIPPMGRGTAPFIGRCATSPTWLASCWSWSP